MNKFALAKLIALKNLYKRHLFQKVIKIHKKWIFKNKIKMIYKKFIQNKIIKKKINKIILKIKDICILLNNNKILNIDNNWVIII